MIGIFNTARKQDAVYWPILKNARDQVIEDERGQPQFDMPQELLASESNGTYWAESTEMIMEEGQRIESKSRVLIGIPVSKGGFLFKGKLTDIPDGYQQKPKEVVGASQIIKMDSADTIAGDQTIRVAYL